MTPRSASSRPERRPPSSKDPIKAADKFFSANVGINKMLVVDREDRLRGLVTASDVERITGETRSRRKPARDSQFRLVVGAALSPKRTPDGSLDREAILAHVGNLVEEHVDAVAVSTAHGHTASVGRRGASSCAGPFHRSRSSRAMSRAPRASSSLRSAARTPIKVGQGPGSICTTRIVAGVGIPQLTALYVASRAAAKTGSRILADGGIAKSGDIVKALTLSDAVICGSVLAGCREAPGEIMEIGGKVYKQFRGMGSLAAMKAGSAARYGRDSEDNRKIAAEGIEALKEVSGSVDEVLTNLIGGVQSGMGYLGARTLRELCAKGPVRPGEPGGPEGGLAARRRRGVDARELSAAGGRSWGLPSARGSPFQCPATGVQSSGCGTHPWRCHRSPACSSRMSASPSETRARAA